MSRRRIWPLPVTDPSKHSWILVEADNLPEPGDYIILHPDGTQEGAMLLDDGRWFHHGYLTPVMWRPAPEEPTVNHPHRNGAGRSVVLE